MLRVMLVTTFCDFSSSPALAARRAMEFGDSNCATHESCHGILRIYFFRIVVFCCVLQLVGCTSKPEPSPDLVNEIHTLEQRTVSPDGSLQDRGSIVREPMAIEANWKIRISSSPGHYFDWVKRQMGYEFHVVSQTESTLTMGKILPSDSYTLEFEDSRDSTIDVKFLAMGD